MKKPKEKLVRVIVDARDASNDKFIPQYEAKALYEQGKLAFDMTNAEYTVKGKRQ